MVTRSTFNSWLELKTGKPESENVSKMLFSLCSVFIKVAKKILRSPTPAFLEHWERNYSFLYSYPYLFLPPKSSLLLLCSISVVLKADNSHHLPNREAGNQESFGVSSVGQCRRMEGSLSFSSCFRLNCSSWCNLTKLLKMMQCLKHPLKISQWPQDITSYRLNISIVMR